MSDSGGGKSHSTDPNRKVCFFTGYFVIYLKSTAPVVQYETVNWSKLEIRELQNLREALVGLTAKSSDKGKEAN